MAEFARRNSGKYLSRSEMPSPVLGQQDNDTGDRRQREERDLLDDGPAPRAGAVNMIQRFDSALRLNVHSHMLVLG